jgi:hypothetical protein
VDFITSSSDILHLYVIFMNGEKLAETSSMLQTIEYLLLRLRDTNKALVCG